MSTFIFRKSDEVLKFGFIGRLKVYTLVNISALGPTSGADKWLGDRGRMESMDKPPFCPSKVEKY